MLNAHAVYTVPDGLGLSKDQNDHLLAEQSLENWYIFAIACAALSTACLYGSRRMVDIPSEAVQLSSLILIAVSVLFLPYTYARLFGATQMQKVTIQYKEAKGPETKSNQEYEIAVNERSILLFRLENNVRQIVEISDENIWATQTSASEDVLGRIIESEAAAPSPPAQGGGT
jgi:hypothetical protein